MLVTIFLEPLRIILHPTEEAQTDILKIPFGRHLRICCKAVGMPAPSYVWYHGDKQLQNCTSDELDVAITRYMCLIRMRMSILSMLSTVVYV